MPVVTASQNDDRLALGQHFIIGFSGTSLSDDFKKFIQEHHIGGVIYFKQNYDSPTQIAEISDEIQSLLRSKSYLKLPTFVAVDQEGGRVQRFTDPFTRIPPMSAVGLKNSPSLAFDLAECIAKELCAVGVNVNFAPVLDVSENRTDHVIGDRAVSNDPEIVAKVGSALVRGYQKGGLLAVPKHFPGHGLTKVDSHSTLPVVDKSLAEIESTHLMPFRRALRARCEGIMVAHLKFPKVDPDFPVTLSKVWIHDVFRGQMRFQKLIFSDDMEMGALTEFFAPTEAALHALLAGTDILIYKGSDLNALAVIYEHALKALETGELPRTTFDTSTHRVVSVKREPDFKFGEPTNPTNIRETVGAPSHHALVKAILTP